MIKLSKINENEIPNNLNNDLGGRRLSNSRSTGDLMQLLKKEFNLERKTSPFFSLFVVNDLAEKNVGSTSSLADDMVVCGFLYRLTATGIWHRLWVELRFNYLMGFYQQTDNLPVDVINLEGYSVKKAEECDHLEALFPIKVYKKGEKNLYFYTESEESRMEWMTNLKKTAHQEILSFNIEGLNLEFDLNIKKSGANQKNENGRRLSTVIRNINNKKINDMTVMKDETDDNSTKLDLKLAEEVRNKYERAAVLTQHEALRIQTYYSQRRISTQIKVQALEDVIGEQQSTGKSKRKPLQEQQLDELRHRLSDIENQRQKKEKAVEHVLHQLESNKTIELTSLNAPIHDLEDKETEPRVKVIKEDKRTIIQEPIMRKSRPTSISLNRHSFSPGDKQKNEDKNFFGSLSDFRDIVDVKTPSPKRSPLKYFSNAMRSIKKDKKDSSPKPNSPTELSPNNNKAKFDYATDEKTVCRSEKRMDHVDGLLDNKSEPQSPCLPSPVPKFSKRIRRFFSFNSKSSRTWSPT